MHFIKFLIKKTFKFFTYSTSKQFSYSILISLTAFISLIVFVEVWLTNKLAGRQCWPKESALYSQKNFDSECPCKQNESIRLENFDCKHFGVYLIKNQVNKTHLYNILKSEFEQLRFTCNMFSSLRRGKHLKVVSYSLFGKEPLFYHKLRDLAKQIKRFYPNWLMRIYHDSSINRSVICDIECATDDNTLVIMDNSDFCDLTNVHIEFEGSKMSLVEFVLPRMWRFLAIGDSFVDIFSSRDSDSEILQREVDSVDAWIASNKILHAMRDHPQHGTAILAGMWGFKIQDDRKLAKKIYDSVINPSILKKYNPNRSQPKGKFIF
jgi:hypothetical protein